MLTAFPSLLVVYILHDLKVHSPRKYHQMSHTEIQRCPFHPPCLQVELLELCGKANLLAPKDIQRAEELLAMGVSPNLSITKKDSFMVRCSIP